MSAICETCGNAAMYTVKVNGADTCEECIDLAHAITDPEARREAYSGRTVTLNGKPAIISGFALDFASVGTLDPSGGAFQWSWHAVARIVSRGGRFIS